VPCWWCINTSLLLLSPSFLSLSLRSDFSGKKNATKNMLCASSCASSYTPIYPKKRRWRSYVLATVPPCNQIHQHRLHICVSKTIKHNPNTPPGSGKTSEDPIANKNGSVGSFFSKKTVRTTCLCLKAQDTGGMSGVRKSSCNIFMGSLCLQPQSH
jgi:hypothetical protein